MDAREEHLAYIKELKRRIKVLSKFEAPGFWEEKAALEGKLKRVEENFARVYGVKPVFTFKKVKIGKIKPTVVNYRIEKDGKFWADIDGSGRFGVPFSSYKAMRKGIRSMHKLRRVK